MSRISVYEASDLLKKLFDERTPVKAFFTSPAKARIRLDGFIAGATLDQGLYIGDCLPPETPANWINVFPFREGECIFDYGEKREITEDVRIHLTTDLGESALIIRFIVTDELLSIFFTV